MPLDYIIKAKYALVQIPPGLLGQDRQQQPRLGLPPRGMNRRIAGPGQKEKESRKPMNKG